jgi:glycosyltransferase involved in cell wall biosynthesis
MDPMRPLVLMFVHCYPPARGGLELLAGYIKQALDAQYDVQVFTGAGSTLDSYKTFKDFVTVANEDGAIHRLPLRRFAQRVANKLLNRIIFKLPDFAPWYFGPLLSYGAAERTLIAKSSLILGLGLPTQSLVDAHRFAKEYGKKCILLPAYHNVPYYNNCTPFREALQAASSVICLSSREREDLMRAYGLPRTKISLLLFSPYTQVQVDERLAGFSAALAPRLKRVASGTVTLGYVGQISKRKSLERLRDVLQAVRNQGIPATLLLAGARTNDAPRVEADFAEELKQGIVRIEYDFADKEAVYDRIDIFLNPSTEESLGIVNFEALYHAMPVFVPAEAPFAEFDGGFAYKTPEEVATRIVAISRDPSGFANQVATQMGILKTINASTFAASLARVMFDLLRPAPTQGTGFTLR